MKKYIDKKLFSILMCYVVLYHVVYIFRRTVLKLMEIPDYGDISWWRVITDPIVTNALVVAPIVIIVMVLTRIMILRSYSWGVMIIVHFFFSFVYNFLLFLSLNIYNYILSAEFIAVFSKEAVVIMLFRANLNFLGYVGFVVIIYAYYYLNRTVQAEVQRAQLSEQLSAVRMEALKSQLKPHFLFNTLNSISALIQEDGTKARSILINLSDLLREFLLIKRANLITVKQEMQLTNKYIDIMKTRFSDHLVVHTNVATSIEDHLIPSMILQPIVENAVKHGYNYDITSIVVQVSIGREDEWMVVEIINNGAPLDYEKASSGLGLNNIKERLKSLYGTKYQFSIENMIENKGVATILKIPMTQRDKKQLNLV